MSASIKPLTLNRPQLRASLSKWVILVLIWSRGTGKSTFIAWIIHLIVQFMPRSCSTIIGRTYHQIMTRTMPSTIASLERLGYYKDVHYFIGRKPPKAWGWPEPYEPPLSYDYVMIWYNGTAFEFVSQDREGMGRGPNRDFIIADESLTLNKKRFDDEISPTNRGNLHHFGHVPFHHGIIFASSMPFGAEGKWLLDLEKESIDNPEVYFSEANIFENLDNVGMRYVKQLMRVMTSLSFRIEVLNERVSTVEEGFYPALNLDLHSYADNAFNYSYIDSLGDNFKKLQHIDSRMDLDCAPARPLEISVDWGASINSMVVCQEHWPEFRVVKNLYVKYPEILDGVFEKFIEYYKYHQDKTVYFWYDRNGNSRKENSRLTNAERGAELLRKAGWNVIMKSRGLDPLHQDKSSERNKNIDQSEATHFSDAIDIIVYGKYKSTLRPQERDSGIIVI